MIREVWRCLCLMRDSRVPMEHLWHTPLRAELGSELSVHNIPEIWTQRAPPCLLWCVCGAWRKNEACPPGFCQSSFKVTLTGEKATQDHQESSNIKNHNLQKNPLSKILRQSLNASGCGQNILCLITSVTCPDHELSVCGVSSVLFTFITKIRG